MYSTQASLAPCRIGGSICREPPRAMGQLRIAQGFTLIELLVVLAIIGLLAGLVGFNLEGSGLGVGLQSAQRDLVGMLQATRANAILEGVPARMIIYSDNNLSNDLAATTINARKLRYYGIIYQIKDPKTGVVTWSPANPNGGTYLPEGIYFLPKSSQNFAKNLPQNLNNSLASGSGSGGGAPAQGPGGIGPAIGTMKLQYPQPFSAEGTGDEYYYIEFQPNGVFFDTATGHTSANIIVGAAKAANANEVDFGANDNPPNQMLGGAQIRYLGGIQVFRNLEDMR